MARVLARLEGKTIPEPVMTQFLPKELAGKGLDRAEDILIASVQNVLRIYAEASQARPA